MKSVNLTNQIKLTDIRNFDFEHVLVLNII